MDASTAGTLVSVITGLSRAVAESHTKIRALEDVIFEREPSLLGVYQSKLREVSKNPPFVIDLEAISRLESILARG